MKEIKNDLLRLQLEGMRKKLKPIPFDVNFTKGLPSASEIMDLLIEIDTDSKKLIQKLDHALSYREYRTPKFPALVV